MERFDLRQTLLAFSLLEISNRFQRMKCGEVIEIVWSDREIPSDLSKVLAAGTHEVILREEIRGEAPGFRIKLKKREPASTADSRHRQNQRRHAMSNVDLKAVTIASTVDARGSACPGPLLEAKKGIGKVRVGEILEVYSNDAGTRKDIPAWTKKVGHEYLGVQEADGYDKHFVRRNK